MIGAPMRPAAIFRFAISMCAWGLVAAACDDPSTLWIAPNAGETAIHLVDIEPNPF